MLLRYPSPEPHEPYDFVNDALYLEQNPTAERGSFIISQYSGKPPIGPKRQQSVNPARRARLWQDFTSRSEGGPLGRNSPKSLESLFQDVSQGIQRRTESWGVAKAVRGAVTEARKNMQTMHYDPPQRVTVGRHQKKPSTASRISHDVTTPTEFGLEKKISQLEERNKELSIALGDALKDLRSELTKTEDLSPRSNDAIEQALARAESVRSALQDPLHPVVPATPVQVPVDDQSEETPKPTNDNNRAEVALKDQQGTPQPNADAGGPSAESGFHEPVSIATGRQKVSGKADGERAMRIERTPVRPSLTESGFSWMLEGSRNVSSFVSSASVPPEQTRNQDHARNKSNPLFGNGDDRIESDTEYDELALRSLRGDQGPL